MTGPVLYSDSGRQQKCSQSSSSLIIPGITSAQLLPPVETSQYCFGVLHFAYLPVFGYPVTWPPSPLWTAFPSSLAGRDSCDYYGACVTLGLAPLRRSHVRPCHTR